jgi:hypothetical protein
MASNGIYAHFAAAQGRREALAYELEREKAEAAK